MTTLYLAWQDYNSRRWFPVGRLDADENAQPTAYEFAYISGAEEARQQAQFHPIIGFPELAELYRSDELFPLFRNRLMNRRRPDRPAYLQQLGLNPDDWNPVSELAASGLHRDNFEVFPAVVPDDDGRFDTRFVLHGLRHTNADSIRRTETLVGGEPLQLSFELNNPVVVHAITVKTSDQYMLGWLPRYLVDGLHQDDAWKVTEVKAAVAQLNRDAPLSHRLLVNFSGKLPPGFRMEDLPQYRPLAAA